MRAVDLYRFVSNGTVYTLASASKIQSHNGEDYVPAPVGRGGTQTKGELSKANLDVTLPLDHELAIKLLSSWVDQLVSLTVFTKRPTGTNVIWKGRLASVQPGDANVKLVFESIFTSMRRPGLRARFQKSCRHPLYGPGCNLNYEDFANAATVTAIVGLTITSPEAGDKPDGYYNGGMIAAPDGNLSYISAHEGTQLKLNRLAEPLRRAYVENVALPGPTSLAVTLYPGCPHTIVVCDERFDNADNYGGFDYIPNKNPMGGSSIV